MGQSDARLGLDTPVEQLMVAATGLLELVGTQIRIKSCRFYKEPVTFDFADLKARSELISVDTLGDLSVGDRFFGDVEIGIGQSSASANVFFLVDSLGEMVLQSFQLVQPVGLVPQELRDGELVNQIEKGVAFALRLTVATTGLLRQPTAKKAKRSIMELQGLGKDLWKGIDAQEYVDEERASWNG